MDLRQVLQSEMIMAMKSQDRLKMAVLRSVLGAINEAEGVPEPTNPATGQAGSTNPARRDLPAQRIKLIVLDEVAKQRNSAEYFEAAGRIDQATQAAEQAAILERYLYLTP
ncbi:MAG: GatB/YqeY domain-containing protein [Actinomycetota bacterium]